MFTHTKLLSARSLVASVSAVLLFFLMYAASGCVVTASEHGGGMEQDKVRRAEGPLPGPEALRAAMAGAEVTITTQDSPGSMEELFGVIARMVDGQAEELVERLSAADRDLGGEVLEIKVEMIDLTLAKGRAMKLLHAEGRYEPRGDIHRSLTAVFPLRAPDQAVITVLQTNLTPIDLANGVEGRSYEGNGQVNINHYLWHHGRVIVVPWRYWWYDSHSHKNWWYGNYWWWWHYYRWYEYEWYPWYNWYWGWYHWRWWWGWSYRW